MQYVSIDIETLGLDVERHDIIEFGAVIDDTKNPKAISDLRRFHSYIYREDEQYCGSAYAMSMHSAILQKLALRAKYPHDNFCTIEQLPDLFRAWLEQVPYKFVKGKVLAAGKNFANFDKPFLLRGYNEAQWEDAGVVFHHRSFDPAILYFSPVDDEEIPSSADCMARAGIQGEVAHTAIDDALMVIRLLRNKWFPAAP